MAVDYDIETPTRALGVPIKFLPTGEIQQYPGNTLICHIPPDSSLLPLLERIYQAYKTHPSLASYIRLLPPSSWHMTVLDGVRERECEPGMWPPDKPKQPLPDSTREIGDKLHKFGLQMAAEGLGPPYRMKVCGFERTQCGMGLEVSGVDASEEKRLRRLRDRLADTLGVRAPNHQVYVFHVTVAYLLKTLVGKSKKQMVEMLQELMPEIVGHEFQLGAVEFCTFDDMEAFHRLFYLGAA